MNIAMIIAQGIQLQHGGLLSWLQIRKTHLERMLGITGQPARTQHLYSLPTRAMIGWLWPLSGPDWLVQSGVNK